MTTQQQNGTRGRYVRGKGASPATVKARALAARVAAMDDDERAQLAERVGTVFNPAGHALTVRNAIMLHMQSGRDDLTCVAGFRQWINAGRAVRKGEHAVGLIMVPITIRHRDANGEPDGGDPMLRFRFVPVFDVTQTDELVVA